MRHLSDNENALKKQVHDLKNEVQMASLNSADANKSFETI